MNSALAPIVLFVFNRPQHTRKTVMALAANAEAKDSILYIYCDGPKGNATAEQLESIKQVRQIAKEEKRFKEIIVNERNENFGLAKSVITGVTEIINKHGKVIVVEDDLVSSPYFLQFMNDALNVYASSALVACISGYVYPVKGVLPDTFFLKGADCWGWATWKRAWDIFEPDGKKLLDQLQAESLTSAFDFDGTYAYTTMLQEQIDGKNNSWAIRWYASAFLKNMYCLYPGVSLIQNIGIDGSGENSGVSKRWKVQLAGTKLNVNSIAIEENLIAKKYFSKYFITLRKSHKSLFERGMNRLKRIIK